MEINRRHSVARRQQEIVDSYRKELTLLYKGETQRRETFFDSYGRFLPQSLVPTLSEPITRFQIFPEKVVNNLPILDSEQLLFQQQLLQRGPPINTNTSTTNANTNTTTIINSTSISSTSGSNSLTPQSQRQTNLPSPQTTSQISQQQKSIQK